MQKASKWIRNHITRKKEEKHKVDKSGVENSIGEGPRAKRRWSLRRKSSARMTANMASRTFSASFDSTHSAHLRIQSLLCNEAAPYSFSTSVLPEIHRVIQSAAATRIQTAFRSYLARKALHALKALVKIQALVRGYLVRKQTSATLRGMHALMAIQVRARIQRLQAAQEADLPLAKHSSRHPQIPRGNHLLREESKDSKNMDLQVMWEIMESRSSPLDASDSGHVVMPFYSKQKYQCKAKDNALTAEQSSWGNNQSSSQRYSVSWAPNDLRRTESSRAKARACSAPKQRPVHKSKSDESTEDLHFSLDGRRQSMSSKSSRFIYHGNLDDWVMNHYESSTDSKSESFNCSVGLATNLSYY